MQTAICYVSNKIDSLTQEQASDLFNYVQKENNALGITGILICKNDNFFQILEGDTVLVKNMYTKITKDTRHNGIIKLLEIPLDYRVFEDYDTGRYSIIHSNIDKKKLKVYFDWVSKANNLAADKLIKMTSNFLKF